MVLAPEDAWAVPEPAQADVRVHVVEIAGVFAEARLINIPIFYDA